MRKWRPFDQRIISAELRALPSADFYGLTAAMRAYARNLGVGYEVKAYGDGLMMVKDASRGQGRCLFFAVRREADGSETVIALLVYKKESQEAPKRIIQTARRRMEETE